MTSFVSLRSKVIERGMFERTSEVYVFNSCTDFSNSADHKNHFRMKMKRDPNLSPVVLQTIH